MKILKKCTKILGSFTQKLNDAKKKEGNKMGSIERCCVIAFIIYSILMFLFIFPNIYPDSRYKFENVVNISFLKKRIMND